MWLKSRSQYSDLNVIFSTPKHVYSFSRNVAPAGSLGPVLVFPSKIEALGTRKPGVDPEGSQGGDSQTAESRAQEWGSGLAVSKQCYSRVRSVSLTSSCMEPHHRTCGGHEKRSRHAEALPRVPERRGALWADSARCASHSGVGKKAARSCGGGGGEVGTGSLGPAAEQLRQAPCAHSYLGWRAVRTIYSAMGATP